MNSENPYYITQAQALGAPNVLKFGLEPLPTSYLVIGEGTSAWFVGNVRGIPFDKPKIAACILSSGSILWVCDLSTRGRLRRKNQRYS